MQSGRCLPLRSSLGNNRHASLLNERRLCGFSFPRKPEPSSAFPALAAKCAYNVTKYFINCSGRGLSRSRRSEPERAKSLLSKRIHSRNAGSTRKKQE